MQNAKSSMSVPLMIKKAFEPHRRRDAEKKKREESVSLSSLRLCVSALQSLPRPALLLLIPLLNFSCILSKPSLKPFVTNVDIAQAQPDYWWNKPGVTKIADPDFEKLWSACKGEMYVRLYVVDREQYREGLLTSEPLLSKQIFEVWRPDVISPHDQAESSLATIRRTVHFEVVRQPDGMFEATPKVLIERYASAERRLTTITQYHQAFSGPRTFNDAPDQSGVPAAADYWYPLRRDTDLEKVMADDIRGRLTQQ